MSATENSIQLPKPIMIGAGILILLGLFLASGDPGKKERLQLSQSMTEAQHKIESLEKTQADTLSQLTAQQETTQLLLKRLEVGEETNTRLRARIDEVERQMVAQRKAIAQSAKAPIKATQPSATKKSNTGTKTTTASKK